MAINTDFKDLPIYSFDYNKIENFCLSQKNNLDKENIGLILGVLRGGGVPALILSQMLSLPVDFMYYDRKNAQAFINQETLKKIEQCIQNGKKILLTEDVAGIGYTLVNCYQHLLNIVKNPSHILTFTLIYHSSSRMKPNYYKDFSHALSVLPWEKYITNKEFFNEFLKIEEAVIGDAIYKKRIAIHDTSYLELTIKENIKIDYHFDYQNNTQEIIEQIKIIGPEEIYCNNDELISLILEKFPFIIIYKTIKNKQYRIDLIE